KVNNNKGPEAPLSGKYVTFDKKGFYLCKRCGNKLFSSKSKFNSGCGWPSFDQSLKGSIREIPDADGVRTEIVCAACGAHLGHVFRGEGHTPQNTRHCVNSISLDFVLQEKNDTSKAYFAGGCFWGVEYYFEKMKGVEAAISGYMGGDLKNPGYGDVSRGDSGHLEVVQVIYNPRIIDFRDLAKHFFEIHDPTQEGGQGPDVGPQYISAVFYHDDEEKLVIKELISILKMKGYDVVTKLKPVSGNKFYPAENYHQNYYEKKGSNPYCHVRRKRF
ncbi:MAG: bifunctional methionine sulfoxide reductase B/A protein, partial [Deltaproteobacteria bacterium]|nr:bifunctional methionine sulfoxide reductase B/A protein [Deltaproteobacteria bacterium]